MFHHKSVLSIAAVLVVGLAIGWTLHPLTPARADAEKANAGGPAYTVVETEGHNLIVVDNKTNTLYFYTIDKNTEVGSELKLRGSLDLSQVGAPVLKPKTNKK